MLGTAVFNFRSKDDSRPPSERSGETVFGAIRREVRRILEEDPHVIAGEVEIKLGHSHPDWNKGDPCPECGATELLVMESQPATYSSERGDFVFLSREDPCGPVQWVRCTSCDTPLETTPHPRQQ